MKILALVFAARRDEKSVTLQMTKEICGMIRQRCGAAEFEIVTMSELPVQACVGCKTCFLEGFCPQDSADGMAALRQKLHDCDALIAATPVYMCSVSGWCKNFLDRCARWCHVFELLGKPCLVLSVTGITGAERASGYLSECLEGMGSSVAARLPLQKLGDGLTVDSEAARAPRARPWKTPPLPFWMRSNILKNIFRILEIGSFRVFSKASAVWKPTGRSQGSAAPMRSIHSGSAD